MSDGLCRHEWPSGFLCGLKKADTIHRLVSECGPEGGPDMCPSPSAHHKFRKRRQPKKETR